MGEMIGVGTYGKCNEMGIQKELNFGGRNAMYSAAGWKNQKW